MVGCESKNGHQRDMCQEENGIRAQNLLTFLSLKVYIIGDLHDHSIRKRIFTWTMNKIFIGAPKIIRARFRFTNRLKII